jgi:hypothetical protein
VPNKNEKQQIDSFDDDDYYDKKEQKKPMIEVISEKNNIEEEYNEDEEDYLIMEHFAKLEKMSESNPHNPTEMIKVLL